MQDSGHESPLSAVRARIAQAASRAGRDPAGVTLIAVSKTHPPSSIAALIGQGQTVFGENRVQEAASKFPELMESAALELHLIGPLQTNKAREAVALFDALHSLDREKLARAIAEAAAKAGRCPRLLVQVNTGAEAQKSGIAADEAEAFVTLCRNAYALPVEGLMCIPPFGADPAPHFEQLARLAGDLGLSGLSMGMSADFDAAIAHGATHVRVGSALFGARR
jgi:pyridoxal phosphate enzyme (YggS family)